VKNRWIPKSIIL